MPLRILAVLLFASAAAWWMVGRVALSPAEIAMPSPAVPTMSVDWPNVLEELDRMRFRAFEARDENLLRLAVEPESPAFARDIEALEEMIATDLEVSGLSAQVLKADEKFKRWSGNREFVALRVKDVRTNYATTIGGSESVRVEERSARWWTVTLSRSSNQDAWRVWNVEASE